jgi:hypothetical protein
LPPRCKDHALKNDWSGYRDAHIEPDWLLIYRMDQEIVRFERTGCWLQWYAVTPAKLCRHLAEATLQTYLGTRFRRIPPVSDGENSQFPKTPI